MHSAQQLLFAQHFPFTGTARKIVEGENLSLSELPEPVTERAVLMAKSASSGQKYFFELHSSDLLLQEILAFPAAKILVSFSNDPGLYRKFSAMVADSAYEFLSREKDKGKEAVSLASELGAKFDFSPEKDFFVSMPLKEFLSVPFSDNAMKLVNQFVKKGSVFLDLNGFCRFLREKAFSAVFSSLPVPVQGLPQRLQSIAAGIRDQRRALEKKLFEDAFRGKIEPDAFPPCVSSMYRTLASGQKLQHMANFTLATFLNGIGMPKQQILALFRKSSNFSERIASYQIDRIAKQNYSPPSCEKIRSYGLCPQAECRVKHPLSFYRRHLKKSGTQTSGAKEKDAKGANGTEASAAKGPGEGEAEKND